MTEPEWLIGPRGKAHLVRSNGHTYCGKYRRAQLRPGDTDDRCGLCKRWHDKAQARQPSTST